MSEHKNTFIFNLEWDEILSELPREVKYEVYDAIIEYARSGKLPDLKPIAKGVFLFIKKEMDRNETKYKESVSNGKRGGNPNFKKGSPNPYYNSKKDKDKGRLGEITQDNPHITQDNLNEYDSDYVNDNVSSPSIPQGGGEAEVALEKKIEDYKKNRPIWKDGMRKKYGLSSKEIDRFLDKFCLDMKCREVNVRKVSALFDGWLSKILTDGTTNRQRADTSWSGNNGTQFRGAVDFDCGLIED